MKRHTFKIAGAVFLLAAVLCAPATAQRAEVATADVAGGSLYWNVHVGYDGLKLTVAGEGRYVARTFESGETPSFSIFDADGEPLADGTYNWELVVLPKLRELKPEEFENLRSSVDGTEVRHARAPERQVASGAFSVRGGQIVNPDLTEGPVDGPAGQGNVLSAKDFVINDDLITIGSLCVGFDCVNGEVFSFDTIRLKENNLRIKFEDTSGGSFPTRDWEIEINSSANGGQTHFRVNDVDAGRAPFTIEGAAPSHSLYVDSSGRVGLGTSNPIVELHVVDGDTPTLRLEQDTSSGFGAQIWDVAGNETNFFVRDATNGSTLPFRIFPGSSSSSLVIRDSDVGVGTSSPSEALHVRRSNASATNFLVENTNGTPQVVSMTLDNTSSNLGSWEFRVAGNGNLTVNDTDSTGQVILFAAATGEVIVPGDLTVNGSFSNPSSRTLKTDIEPVDPAQILQRVVSLPINEWTYTEDETQRRHIGPFSEDFGSLFGLGTKGKNIIPMDVQGVTIAAVQGLYQTVQTLEEQNANLEQQNSNLLARLESLEQRLMEAESSMQ